MAAAALLKCLGILAALIALTAGEKIYKGYQVIRITPSGESQENAHHLMRFLVKSKLDVWRAPPPHFPGGSTDVMVSPLEAPALKTYLKQGGFNTSVMIDDVDTLVAKEKVQTRKDDQLDSSSFHWVGYHSLERIHKWLHEKARIYSSIASVISAGKSVEGREILGLRIARKENLPIVFIEAGIHAREWVGTATATWFIRQVLSANDAVLNAYEWHIFPSVNPDGYAFTREVRLWRKNRRQPAEGGSCVGVDLNRNWPFQWAAPEDGDCGDAYPGTAPGSEPETKALVQYLDSVAKRTKVYISLHSYSQLLMYPWAYTSAPTNTNQRLGDISKKAADKLTALYGTKYTTGPISTTIYPAFGSTLDYAYNVGIPYPFVFELRDTGNYGFLLPKEHIIPTAQETLEALTVILKEAQQN